MTASQYKRYVDDINAIVRRLEGQSASDLVLRLKEIADSVLEGIEVEIDLPENHPDGKLPILDMKSWLDPSGNILYQHNEKPMASKQSWRHQGELLNSKSEFHQPPLLQVRSEVVRGIA